MRIKLKLLNSTTKQTKQMDKIRSRSTKSRAEESYDLRNTSSLVNIYDASVFLKTTLNDVRYRSAQQFVTEIVSDPPSILNSYICVNIIVGQLEFHRNYLSAIHIVFLYYWDVVRKDNIINKVLVDLCNTFESQTYFVREMIVRADKCLKRIEKEMTFISRTIKMANITIWRYSEELNQIKHWSYDQ